MPDEFNKNRYIYNLGLIKLRVPYFVRNRAKQEARQGRITRLWEGRLNLIDLAIFIEEIRHDDEIIKLFPRSPIAQEIRRADILGKEVVSEGESSDDEPNAINRGLPRKDKVQHRLLFELFTVAQTLAYFNQNKVFKQIEISGVLEVGIILLNALKQNALQSDPRMCLVDERFAVFMQQFALLVNWATTEYAENNQARIQQNKKIKCFKEQVENYIEVIKEYHRAMRVNTKIVMDEIYSSRLAQYTAELEQWEKQFAMNVYAQLPTASQKGWCSILCGAI